VSQSGRNPRPTRIQALRDLSILDTPPDERFDRLTRLARRLFDVPSALVHLEAVDRLWFRGADEEDEAEVSGNGPEHTFCERLGVSETLFVIPDTRDDDRVSDDPLVTGDDGIRFIAGAPVKAPDGGRLGTLCIVDRQPREMDEDDRLLLRDLGDLVEQEFAALELATIDELTGLTNRRGFNAISLHTLALCRRLDRPATLLLFDLDDFKQINDTLGHAAGDKALVGFAQDLEATFRDSDVVSRLGGDEFAVLLSGASPEEIRRPLTILGVRIEARNEQPDAQAEISYSVGAAGYDPDIHRDIADLAAEADRRMYAEKGRRKA
jgi:diguanylate cyclase (GGDEF)-like protein